MKIEIKQSSIHGEGVFALASFEQGEVIEQSPMIVLPKTQAVWLDKTELYNYYFEWGEHEIALALGIGSLFNHSYQPNAAYSKEFRDQRLVFTCLRPIQAGEEITVNYNGDPVGQEQLWFEVKE